MKTYAVGDIHGAYKALMQCFERSKFDYKKDRLIVMGDVCDGYLDVKQCIDELLRIKHCDLVIGNPDISFSSHSAQALVWDRRLLDMAWKKQIDGHKCQLGKYKDMFVGRTTTEFYNRLQPIHVCNVWNIDTGAGWSGKLTIMDVDIKEYWQADLTPDLYGGTPDRVK